LLTNKYILWTWKTPGKIKIILFKNYYRRTWMKRLLKQIRFQTVTATKFEQQMDQQQRGMEKDL
jgi:hypothetical protein